MGFEKDLVNGVTVLRPLGRLDSAQAPELEATVRALLDGGAKALVFDLSKLAYISSAGLRVVLLAGKQLRASGGKLVLCGVSGLVLEVFEMSGFLNLFPVATDVPAALSLTA